MLNNEQIKLVQVAAKKAGIRTPKFDGRYRMLLGQYLQPNKQPVTSCKQLSNSQLDDFLAICEAAGFRQPGKSETYYRDKVAAAGDYASFAQQMAIGYLSKDLGMTPAHLANFILTMTKTKPHIVQLSPIEAGKIIEALKAILKKKTGVKFDSLESIKEYYSATENTENTELKNLKGAKDGKETESANK